jgi:transposase-like protein
MAGEREKTAMSKRRKWDAKTKAMIVMQGLKGTPVADICTEYQISQAQYYQWRDQFMKQLPKVFENTEKKQASLAKENERLKKMIGELTVELKKTEEWLK